MRKKIRNFCLCIILLLGIFGINVEAIDKNLAIETEKVQVITEWEEGGNDDIRETFLMSEVEVLSDTQFTESYKDQLEEIEMNVYQAMYAFEENMSLEFIEMNVGEDFVFTTTYGALQSGSYSEEEIYNQVRMKLRNHVFRAADAYLKDQTNVYWIKKISYQATITYPKTVGIEESTLVEAKISKIRIKRILYYDEILEEDETVKKALAEALSYINAQNCETRYDFIRNIYDYVKQLAEYNYDYPEAESNHTLTGILLDKYKHKCTCEGYAKLVKRLCDYYSIPNTMVIGGSTTDENGNVNTNHVWNVVKMEDGKWYLVDTTWDDTGAGNRYLLAGNSTVGSSGRTVAEEYLGSGYFSYTAYTPFVLPVLAERSYEQNNTEDGDKMKCPSAVKNLKVCSAGKKQTYLSWDKSDDAEGYLIYGSKNGAYGYVGMTKGTAFKDKKALDYIYNYYWVFPYVTDETGKMYPGECTEYVRAKGVCPAVTNLKAFQVLLGVKLTWSKSAGAEGYLIYGIVNGKQYGYVGMTTKGTTYINKNVSNKICNYYWVFPYYKNEKGEVVIGENAKYIYEGVGF